MLMFIFGLLFLIGGIVCTAAGVIVLSQSIWSVLAVVLFFWGIWKLCSKPWTGMAAARDAEFARQMAKRQGPPRAVPGEDQRAIMRGPNMGRTSLDDDPWASEDTP